MAHILIDLRWMIPGYSGGIETVARAMVQALVKKDTSHQYSILIPGITRYEFPLHPKVHYQICDGPISYFDKANFRIRKILAKQHRRPLEGNWINGRKTSAQAGISPSGIINPDLRSLPNILIVNDLQHEFFPEFFSDKELQNIRRDYDQSIHLAKRIISISHHTRQTLIDRYQLSPDLIDVAHLAVDDKFKQPVLNPKLILKKYNLSDKPFFFYPANTWPHKNHRLILESLALLNDQLNEKIHLVCTGTPKEAHQEIISQILSLGLKDQFHFLGYIRREDLPAVYHGAKALVFPSLYEGFGIPILEAMTCGCPVLCSNTTSLPEVGGDAALYFDPENAIDLAIAMSTILSNLDLRSEMIAKGYQNSDRFSWDRFAESILKNVNAIFDEHYSDYPRLDNNLGQEKELVKSTPQLGWSRRVRFSVEYIKEAEYQHQFGNKVKAIIYRTIGMVLGPDVFFNSVFFPIFRDQVLRKWLAKLK